MATIVEIDSRSKAAKQLIEYLKTLSFAKVEEKTHYDPKFVKKVKESKKQIEQGEYTVIDTDDVWGSLGL